MTGVQLALAASLCFGVQTLAVTHGLRGPEGAVLPGATVTIGTGAAVLWVVVLARQGLPALPALVLLVPFVVAGIADPGLSRVLFYEGIERVGPSVAAGILSTNPAIGALLAVALLGVRLVPVEGVGVGLVVVGVAGLQVARPTDGAENLDAVRRELQGSSPLDLLVPGVAAVLLTASFVVVKRGFAGYGNVLVATAVAQTAAFVVVAPVTWRSASTRRFARRAGLAGVAPFLVAGVVVGLGWYAMFLALDVGSVVTVLPLVSTYPLLVVAGSYLTARELPRSPTVLAAIVCLVAGAAAVQVG